MPSSSFRARSRVSAGDSQIPASYPRGYGIAPGRPSDARRCQRPARLGRFAPAGASAYIRAVQIPPRVYEGVDPKGTPMSMTAGSGVEVVAIDTPALGDRSYLAHDGQVAVVVDPQRDIDRVLDLAAARGV